MNYPHLKITRGNRDYAQISTSPIPKQLKLFLGKNRNLSLNRNRFFKKVKMVSTPDKCVHIQNVSKRFNNFTFLFLFLNVKYSKYICI